MEASWLTAVDHGSIIHVHSRSLGRLLIELIDNNIEPEVDRKLKGQTIQIKFQNFRKYIFLENFQFYSDLGRKETITTTYI